MVYRPFAKVEEFKILANDSQRKSNILFDVAHGEDIPESLIKRLQKKNFECRVSNLSLTFNLLSNFNGIVFLTPRVRFSLPEIDAISAYVRHGGGILLGAYYTNDVEYRQFIDSITVEGRRLDKELFQDGYFTKLPSPFPVNLFAIETHQRTLEVSYHDITRNLRSDYPLDHQPFFYGKLENCTGVVMKYLHSEYPDSLLRHLLPKQISSYEPTCIANTLERGRVVGFYGDFLADPRIYYNWRFGIDILSWISQPSLYGGLYEGRM